MVFVLLEFLHSGLVMWCSGLVVVARCCGGACVVVRCPLFCVCFVQGGFSRFGFCFCASDMSKSNTKTRS